MPRAPWVCSRCLLRSTRLARRGSRRHQSTAVEASLSSDSIYPILLERAKHVSAQHDVLVKRLADRYDAPTAKKVGELAPVAQALKRWNTAKEALAELRRLIKDPDTDAELRSLASEDLESTTAQLDNASQSLAQSLIPKHPFADLPCLIEIRPGAGGSEAAIFAGDLLRMYQAYCSQNGLHTGIIKLEEAETEPGSVTEAVLEVETPGAYAILRCEAGVHRVQRIPATETKGRVHTSSASVMVLPSISQSSGEKIDFNDPSSDHYVNPKDVRIDVMRANGAGGQHVNRTESAVRLTHIPTNTVVSIQDSRSQLANREKAWQILRSRLALARREAREEEIVRLRRSVVGVAKIGRGDKIRTYNWQQQRVTDHRSGFTIHGIDGILGGGPNLEKIMDSVRRWLTGKEIADVLATSQDGLSESLVNRSI